MNVIECIQFILGIGFLFAGLYVFAVELIGVFKFKYVLNRMHAAAMGDTIGLGLCLVGLMILCGLNYTSLKMALIIVFLWLASPVSSHLIARLEVTTNEEIEKFCDRRDLEPIEKNSVTENDKGTERIQMMDNHQELSEKMIKDKIAVKKSETREKNSKEKAKFQTRKNKKGKVRR